MGSLPRIPDRITPGGEVHLDECIDLLRERIRAVRGAEREWSMRTSELLAAGLERMLRTQRRAGAALDASVIRVQLAAIARNTVIDAIRRRIRERRAMAVIRARAAAAATERAAPDADERSAVAAVLDSLDDADRFLITSRARGLRWAQVGAHLGIGEDAARQRWCTLRLTLRRRLAGIAAGAPGADQGQMPRTS